MVRLLTRLGALVLLLGLLVGFPLFLIAAVGSPWPAGGLNELSMMSNSATLKLVSVLGWLVWAQFLLCTLWEIPPALRHEPAGATRMPIALDGQQRLIRILVHTILAVGVTSTLLSVHAGRADAAPAVPLAPVGHVAVQTSSTAAPQSASKATVNHAQQRTHLSVVTERGDTLWGLADRHLGDGFRWQEIAQLNHGRQMPDGRTFTNPRTLEAGWQLWLPDDATNLPTGQTGAHVDKASTHTVRPGENLTEIAQETTGDPGNWEALYDANRAVIGSNPSLIQPGWKLQVPGATDPTQHSTGPSTGKATQPRSPSGTQPGNETNPGHNTGHDNHGQGTGHTDDPAVPAVPATPAAPATPATPARPAAPSQPATTAPDPQPAAVASPSAEDADEGGGISALDALLASAGALAVGLAGLYVFNRRRQMRERPIGMTIAQVPEEYADVERSILDNADAAQKDIVFLDRALRHMAASCKVARSPLPQLGAAVLGEDDLTLLFTAPAVAAVPEGWEASEDDRAWMLSRETFLDDDLMQQPAPYPALVEIGLSQSGHTWYLDLETLGVCGIAGEAEQVEDLTRFFVSELAVNQWAEGVEVLLAEPFGDEMVGLNPARVRQVPRADALARAASVAGELDLVERNLDADVLTRRRDSLVTDSANPVVVVLDTHVDEDDQDRGEGSKNTGEAAGEGDVVAAIAGRRRSRVVLLHADNDSPAVELRGDGTAYLPMWGISLQAFTMPAEQAARVSVVYEATRNRVPVPMPNTASDDGPLGKYAKADGSLRDEYTEPRHTEGGDTSSVLPEADKVYLEAGATTAADLAVLGPSVPESTRTEMADLDPTLDADVADWFDETCTRPKVHLLGPVEVRAIDGGDPASIPNLNMTVSLIAYLACHEKGVTSERIAADFKWASKKTAENRVVNARTLLGKRPDGSHWLPEAGDSETARMGGTATYKLPYQERGGVLSSADLFIRLRHRAGRRGEAGGCEQDLLTAMSLVTGTPFEGGTDRRFPWLTVLSTQPQNAILCGAITDAAHTLANRGVTMGRSDVVRTACAIERLANPAADVSWLDEAPIKAAEEGQEALDEWLRREVVDRYDEDLPERTETILDQKNWAV
ncbi:MULTISPECIES: LysM peptidoglycan-binding domain-containing protein [unclassified Nocardioides]|uniref:LysM peptidoglycan-binding domain-containing protein n=1 Tax=unclassified Nocardioides TaxID=2615069 RepID=UPI0009F0A63A|nr:MULTISPECIES: LysM peptidoglycan-binding domain-containing protein [unclassified Nocardioides]GAW52565.1 Peptidoglycan-binding LysM (Precursor) [Nocardioides sp. PD653-B2]GAW55596.1 Peptidoglycan-binding LysM (Precursor) [Nocardioides sp. PD653]